MWLYLIVILIPIIYSFAFFKKGKLIWRVPIVYLLIQLLVTIFFIYSDKNIKYAFTGEESILTAWFLPLSSAWSLLCTLLAVLIRFLLNKNKNHIVADKYFIYKLLSIILLIIILIIGISLLLPYGIKIL